MGTLIVSQMAVDNDVVRRNQTFQAIDYNCDLVTLTNNTGLAVVVAAVADNDGRWVDWVKLIVVELDIEFVANPDSMRPSYPRCPYCMGCIVG